MVYIPGKDWWQRFKKQWPSLTERKPQHLSKRRAEAANEATMMSFFDALEKIFKETGLDISNPTNAKRLWNCDETAFSMSATSSKLLCKQGISALHEVGGGSGREYTTVHVCCSASGERLPPFVKEKICIGDGWKEALQVRYMGLQSQVGWMPAVSMSSSVPSDFKWSGVHVYGWAPFTHQFKINPISQRK